jgi:hypothetical protein
MGVCRWGKASIWGAKDFPRDEEGYGLRCQDFITVRASFERSDVFSARAKRLSEEAILSLPLPLEEGLGSLLAALWRQEQEVMGAEDSA